MQQIINFIIREKNLLQFLLLLFISIAITVQSNSYHKTKYSNSANWVSGGIYDMTSSISNYFKLKGHNDQLVEENLRLRTLIFNKNLLINESTSIDTSLIKEYKFYKARIIKN